MSAQRQGATAEQFQGRAALVTGADGFLGSHLVEALVRGDATVHAFVRASSGGGLRNIAHLRDQVVLHRGDLTDRHSVAQAVRALKGAPGQPFIFHLGAQPHVSDSWERPYQTIEVNLLGTLNLLQSVVDQELDLAKLVLAGSSTEFPRNAQAGMPGVRLGDGGVMALGEQAPLNPQSVYGTSKAAAEFLARNFHDAYSVPTVVARMFNHYGPRQSPRYITGTIITQALCKPMVHLGSLEPRRDFCYVEDGVRAHLALALGGAPGSVYCYGHGESISIGEWAQRILEIGREEGHWGHPEIACVPERVRPDHSEVTGLSADIDKLRGDTGWSPATTWDDGLRRTIRWYAENRDRWMGLVDWR